MNVLTKQRGNSGFTIIEVVLVLAIAGLIFLMVFIALPALQRNQRDSQRKNDMGRLSTAIVSYTNANRGALPTPASSATYQTFVTNYLAVGGDTFIDPSGATATQGAARTTYVMSVNTTASLTAVYSDATQNTIYVSPGFTCDAASTDVKAAGSRKVAFRMPLEGGGYYCVNN